MIAKYRGLSLDENMKDKWIYGNLIVDGQEAFIVNGVIESNEQYISIAEWCPVEIQTVGQFTGLVDKEGSEVYEGDVLGYTYQNDDYLMSLIKKYNVKPDEDGVYHIPEGVDENLVELTDYYEVVFEGTIPYVRNTKRKTITEDDILRSMEGFKVMGNIYQHKHLTTD